MYRSIVVGTDGSPSAAKALRRAGQMAQAAGTDDCTVHVVCAYTPLSEDQLAQARSAVPEALRSELGPDMAAAAAIGEAESALADAGVNYVTYSVVGAPTDVILDCAAKVDGEIILVGSRGLTPDGDGGTGSVSSKLVSSSNIDVLVVRTPTISAGSGELDEDAETVASNLGRLGEALGRLETNHPNLVKTINDVSYYLSGMGI